MGFRKCLQIVFFHPIQDFLFGGQLTLLLEVIVSTHDLGKDGSRFQAQTYQIMAIDEGLGPHRLLGQFLQFLLAKVVAGEIPMTGQ